MRQELDHFDDEIALGELIKALWNKKNFISVITFTSLIITMIYSLLLPNIYTSNSILAPSGQDDSLSSKLGSLSSFATISGINLQDEGYSKPEEAIERIKSFEFFSKYFIPNIQYQNLVASKKWNPASNKLVYDKSIFDIQTNSWVSKNSNDLSSQKPSLQRAYKIYKDIMKVTKSEKNQFVTISISHNSPYIAKKWVDIIIHNINKSMREEDMVIAKNAIDYLNETSVNTNIQTIKDSIASLLESQMQVLMLAASNKAYVFKVLDPPIISEEKSAPGRLMLTIMGTIFGFIGSIIFVLFSDFYNKIRVNINLQDSNYVK